jgi:hypothetical protein
MVLKFPNYINSIYYENQMNLSFPTERTKNLQITRKISTFIYCKYRLKVTKATVLATGI